jgi:hypothetical protein
MLNLSDFDLNKDFKAYFYFFKFYVKLDRETITISNSVGKNVFNSNNTLDDICLHEA